MVERRRSNILELATPKESYASQITVRHLYPHFKEMAGSPINSVNVRAKKIKSKTSTEYIGIFEIPVQHNYLTNLLLNTKSGLRTTNEVRNYLLNPEEQVGEEKEILLKNHFDLVSALSRDDTVHLQSLAKRTVVAPRLLDDLSSRDTAYFITKDLEPGIVEVLRDRPDLWKKGKRKNEELSWIIKRFGQVDESLRKSVLREYFNRFSDPEAASEEFLKRLHGDSGISWEAHDGKARAHIKYLKEGELLMVSGGKAYIRSRDRDEKPTFEFLDKNRVDIEFYSPHILIPTVRIVQDKKRSQFSLDPIFDEEKEHITLKSPQPGVTITHKIDNSQLNNLLGLFVVDYLTNPIGDEKYHKHLRRQEYIPALRRQEELLESPFVANLVDHIEKTARP